MALSDKIIEILNNDPHTTQAINGLNEMAKKYNLTSEQYRAAKDILILSLMKDNEKVANAYWEEIGLPTWKEAHPGEDTCLKV